MDFTSDSFRRQLYLRGRLSELRERFLEIALRMLLKDPKLSWYVMDGSGVLLRKYWDDNLRQLIRYGVASDSSKFAGSLLSLTGDVAIDVGSNRGQLAVIFAKKFRQVYCFEPNESNNRELRDTLIINGIRNAIVSQLAVSSTSGTAMMRMSSDYGHHTLETCHLTSVVEWAPVATTTLDEFVDRNSIGTVDLLKIDVEGHELEVLRGAERLLQRRQVRVIIFEHSPVLLKANKHPVDEVANFLSEYDFRFSTFENHELEVNQFQTLGQLDVVARLH